MGWPRSDSPPGGIAWLPVDMRGQALDLCVWLSGTHSWSLLVVQQQEKTCLTSAGDWWEGSSGSEFQPQGDFISPSFFMAIK